MEIPPAAPLESVNRKMETEVENGNPTAEAGQEVCKYYQNGSCRYGPLCRNAHVGNISEIASGSGSSASLNMTATDDNQNNVLENTISWRATSQFDPSKWVNAPVFVPKAKSSPSASANTLSYAEIVTLNNNHSSYGLIEEPMNSDGNVLCPYMENNGVCPLENCSYDHGELCELCGKYCLHPTDTEQRRVHNNECIQQHEQDMEHSFAIQRSKDKVCGICLEIILEKPGREQRFGILPNCNHIFCLDCIRTWRKAKNFENKIKRGCPTCRMSSDFVCPSIIWVDAREEKEKLINDYKKACNTTNCKHFKQGTAKCPFGNKCFYKHALPSGQLVDVGGPSRQTESRRRISSEITELQDFFRQVIQQRDRLLDDFVASFFSDSEESELSEYYDYHDI